VRRWNRPQSAFLKTRTRYVDFEGAIRAGKTTPLVWKIINYALEYPGIKMLLSRWTGDAPSRPWRSFVLLVVVCGEAAPQQRRPTGHRPATLRARLLVPRPRWHAESG